jgi:hypothetical protein
MNLNSASDEVIPLRWEESATSQIDSAIPTGKKMRVLVEVANSHDDLAVGLRNRQHPFEPG